MFKFRFWSLLMVLALVSACNFTEEIYLKDDGSGKISINFDGSEMMEMAGEEMMKGGEKAIDSVISFKSFLEEKKDSIATLSQGDQARLKKLEPFNMRMVMNPETKVMKFDMYSEFENLDEVGDAFNTFQDASSIGPGSKNQASSSGVGTQSTQVEYSFDSNSFKRTAKIVDSVLQKQALDSLAGAEMFLSSSMYKLKYHFPRRVKSSSAQAATFSADGKTLFYEVSFLSYMKNPDTLNIEVELED
ncbi:hypothetical protein [Maribacter sp. HTCC2170]|uniref:hypothetical protein n=1 Tax=Maribacter sp. (strain HTCC2170 / KCCM 42371) TaxID=313603 RepID=UPI00006AE665|nr:hypothetical protein [Maribacter sp. HTCC2170]EAR00623.1 hypothetical protein FB2170_08959 [Maribacter sp. HTCC2170]